MVGCVVTAEAPGRGCFKMPARVTASAGLASQQRRGFAGRYGESDTAIFCRYASHLHQVGGWDCLGKKKKNWPHITTIPYVFLLVSKLACSYPPPGFIVNLSMEGEECSWLLTQPTAGLVSRPASVTAAGWATVGQREGIDNGKSPLSRAKGASRTQRLHVEKGCRQPPWNGARLSHPEMDRPAQTWQAATPSYCLGRSCPGHRCVTFWFLSCFCLYFDVYY